MVTKVINARIVCFFLLATTSLVIHSGEIPLQPDGVSNLFGRAMSVQGDRLAIGDEGDGESGPNAGAVYIYERNPNTRVWSQKHKILAPTGSLFFGWSVAFDKSDNTLLAVGSARNVSLYKFDLANDVWVFQSSLKPQLSITDSYGRKLSFSNNIIVVADQSFPTMGSPDTYGRVFVWEYTKGEVAFLAEIKAYPQLYLGTFGVDLDIFDDLLVVYETGQFENKINVFRKNINGINIFEKIQEFEPPGYFIAGTKKIDIAIFEKHLIIGQPNDDLGGSVYFYYFTDDIYYQKIGSYNPIDDYYYSNFGDSIHIQGNTIAVGATYDTGGGAVYIFKNAAPPHGWYPASKYQVSGESRLGWSVAASEEQVIGGIEIGGRAYVFSGCNPPVIIENPTDAQVCSNNPLTLSVLAAGEEPLSYQWRKNGVDLSGETTAELNFASITNGDIASYTCLISNNCGAIESSAASVTLHEPVTFSSNPTPANTCVGDPVVFEVSVSGTEPINFQWRKNGLPISNQVSNRITIGSVSPTDSGTYDCVVSNECGSVTSTVALLSVNQAPEMVLQPQNVATCLGSPATFMVSASGSEPLTFQWQINGEDIAGANSQTLSIPSVSETDLGNYSCRVSNECGFEDSLPATLALNQPIITTHPNDGIVCSGETISLMVSALGEGLHYQWRKFGEEISGATAAILTINNFVEYDQGHYDCVVSSSCGVVVSNSAEIILISQLVLQSQPKSLNRCVGDLAEFSISATGSGISYQWTRNGDPIPGATSDRLEIIGITLEDSGAYQCLLDNGCGPVISNTAELTVSTSANGVELGIQGQPSQKQGQHVTIPITLANSANLSNIGSFSFGLAYDPAILQFLLVSKHQTLTDTWELFFNEENGILKVAGISTIPLSGDGILVELVFEVNENVSDGICTPLEFLFSTFNETPNCTVMLDNSFCVCQKGDITSNGEITPFDALQILKHTAGLPTEYDPLEICKADTTCNGSITPLDASQILKLHVGLIDEFCGEGNPRETNGLVEFEIPDMTTTPGDSIQIPILASETNGLGIESIRMRIDYEPQLFSLTGIDLQSGLLENLGWVFATNVPEDGVLIFAGAGLQPPEGSGPLVFIKGEQNGNWGQAFIHITELSINEGNPSAIFEDYGKVSIPGFKINPNPAVRGLAPITFSAEALCCDVSRIEWLDLETSAILSENQTLTLNPPPLETSHYQFNLFDASIPNMISENAIVLVAENPVFFDLNGDGTNDVFDLYFIIEEWLRPTPIDANGDGYLDIRDFLFINLGQ